MSDEIKIPDEFHEAYEVVRTLELYSSTGHFRIEMVRVLRGAPDKFQAHYYREVNKGGDLD